jgi:hypothetical protein
VVKTLALTTIVAAVASAAESVEEVVTARGLLTVVATLLLAVVSFQIHQLFSRLGNLEKKLDDAVRDYDRKIEDSTHELELRLRQVERDVTKIGAQQKIELGS